MSAVLHLLQHSAYRYAREMPTDIYLKAKQSLAASVAVNLLVGTSLGAACLIGALAATATLIEALTRPIIKSIFPDNPIIAVGCQIIGPKAIVLSLASVVSPLITISIRSMSIFSLVAWICLNQYFNERNVAMVEVF